MNAKHERFCQEYLVDLNATQAAIRAEYSERTAAAQAARLLKNVNIQNRIAELQAARSLRTEVTMDRVVLELARIAFVDPRRVFKWGPKGVELIDSDSLTDDEAAVIAEVSQTITEAGGSIRGKQYDKIKALELLGKHLGGFVEKREVDVNATINVFDDETRAAMLATLDHE